MDFEQKENSTLKHAIYVSILMAILILSYFIIKKVNFENASNATSGEAVLLTPEQVQVERVRLKDENIKPLITSRSDVSTAVESSVVPDMTKSEIDNYKRKVSIIPARGSTPSGEVAPQVEFESESEIIAKALSDSVIYEPDSAITATIEDSNSEVVDKVTDGTIFSVDNNKKQIVLVQSNDRGLANVKVTDVTKITVNGKLMTLSGLKGSDRLRITGTGYANSSTINAETIELIGVIQANP